jgi:hypothetical protein
MPNVRTKIIPMGRRGATGPQGPEGTVSVSNDDGTFFQVGKYEGGPNLLGGSNRNIRYNIEFTFASSQIGQIYIDVHGIFYRIGSIVRLSATTYSTGSAINSSFSGVVNLAPGTAPTSGWGWSPNNKPFFYFEADNHNPTIAINAVRHRLGNLLQEGVNVHLTEAGTDWT